jgi:hypothetical protein
MELRNLSGLNPTLEEIEINLKAGAAAAKKERPFRIHYGKRPYRFTPTLRV